jgi:hypothetical protein
LTSIKAIYTARLLASANLLRDETAVKIVNLNLKSCDPEVVMSLAHIVADFKHLFDIPQLSKVFSPSLLSAPRSLRVSFVIQRIEALMYWPKYLGSAEEEFIRQFPERFNGKIWDRITQNNLVRLIHRVAELELLEHESLVNGFLRAAGDEALKRLRFISDNSFTQLFLSFSRNDFRHYSLIDSFQIEIKKRFEGMSAESQANLLFGNARFGILDDTLPRSLCKRLEENPHNYMYSAPKILGFFVELGFHKEDWTSLTIQLLKEKHRSDFLGVSSDGKLAQMLYILINIGASQEDIEEYIFTYNKASINFKFGFFKALIYEYFKLNPTSLEFGKKEEHAFLSSFNICKKFGIKPSLLTQLSEILGKDNAITQQTQSGISVPLYLPRLNLAVMPLTCSMMTLQKEKLKRSFELYCDLVKQSQADLFTFDADEFMKSDPSQRLSWLTERGLKLS